MVPKIVDHDERRKEIADAVLDLIARVGIDGVTLREVARVSGWSTGILSHYGGSRDELLLLALRRAAELAGESFRKASQDTSLSDLDKITEIIYESLPVGHSRLALQRIFLFYYARAATTTDDLFSAEMRRYLENWRRVIARCVDRITESGGLPPEADSARIAADIAAIADGSSLHAILDPILMDRLTEDRSIPHSWVTAVLQAAGYDDTPHFHMPE